jgi:Cd2+/Zn2+-exporting ATPase
MEHTDHTSAKKEEGCCSHDHQHADDHQHEDHDHGDEHDHDHGDATAFKTYLPAGISLLLLLSAIAFDHFKLHFFVREVRIGWYLLAYLPVAFPVISMSVKTILTGEIFTEFLLMALATIGALALGEYPEAVAVMLFYTVGELFQGAAVAGAKRNIRALLDVRPTIVDVFRAGKLVTVNPKTVEIGEVIQLKAGDKAPLDGELINDQASFNTAALTGESTPQTKRKGEQVLAGMLNLGQVVTLKVEKRFEDSALSRILALVQSATSRKAKTELFIRKFAKIYTPIVFFLAVALIFLPYVVVAEYHFQTWLYRSLVFLVISCPCALVISIPLGYFGGIGAASANGILFKGSNFLDLITKVNTVVMDKTGTLTKGVFKVVSVTTELEQARFMQFLTTVESKSTHPIAKAIVSDYGNGPLLPADEVKEIAGHGLTAKVDGLEVAVGNVKLFKKLKIGYPAELEAVVETIVLLSIEGKYVGNVRIADELKPDAKNAVTALHANGIKLVMLSGDQAVLTKKVADEIGIEEAYGDLLPEDKVAKLEKIKQAPGRVIAFVGDGINDAPVLALSDVGIAMGAMGSDVAIETADVIIQNDQPSKIAVAIAIGRATKRVVYQNIGFAFGVKLVILLLGAGGLATMWEAVFADVGVAFLAILNAIRIQRIKF